MKNFLATTHNSIKNSMFKGLIALVLGTFVVASPVTFAGDKSSKKTVQMEQKLTKVNINRASIKDLAALKGVGEKKAIAIVQYRTKVGKFKSVDQLAEVKGIGPSIVEKNRKNISL